MALLNRPLTQGKLQEFMNGDYTDLYDNKFIQYLIEPKYQYVRYDAALNRIVYERADTFYMAGKSSPSDCRWMVYA